MDVEETVDAVADVVKDTAKEKSGAVPVVIGLLVFGAGIGIGYILGLRKQHKEEVITFADIQQPTTRPPRVIVDADELERENRPTVVEEAVEDEPVVEVKKETVIETARFPADQETVTINSRPLERRSIFADVDDMDDWDIKAEIQKRNPLSPYIIHRDEFFAEDPEFEDYHEDQLTFYEGDETLVDGQNVPIYDISETVGTIVWGKGSGDPNVCYVRNMVKQAQYEVIRDPGHYAIEVLNLEADEDIEKAQKGPKVRRMRSPE